MYSMPMLLQQNKRKMATYRGNDAVTVKSINKSGNMWYCNAKCLVTANWNCPLILIIRIAQKVLRIENNVIHVPFELARLQKGDKAIMFNVYFYKDAAVNAARVALRGRQFTRNDE
jgi:hypothetical protein